jgi:large subunit ribosomal protein L13
MDKTYQPTKKDIKRTKHEMNAEGKVLGRLATEIVTLLMGKNKPTYSAHIDSGDFVTVTNAEKIVLTGRKDAQKVYYRHSGYPGGFKAVKVSQLRREQPHRIIELAVKRMLPNNRLRDDRMKRLTVQAGEGEQANG